VVSFQPPTVAPGASRDIRGKHLVGEDFSGRDLHLADMIAANLEGARFIRSNLAGAKLHNCRLRHATLHEADLSGVAMRDADLEGASLQGAKLNDADLRGCVLLEADLRGADLRGANLANTDLRGADLTGALLDGASLDGADLAAAHISGPAWSSLSARHARTRGTTGDLVAALKLAGATDRPPLAIGRWAAVITIMGQAASSQVLNAVVQIGRPALHLLSPLARRLTPIGLAFQQLARGAKHQLTATPRRALGLVLRLGTGIGASALKGGELAARVRQEAQSRLQYAAADRAARATARMERDLQARERRASKLQDDLPGGRGADLRGQDFSRAKLAFVLWPQAQLQEAKLNGATLDKADLREANLDHCVLTGAKLRDADLRKASLLAADLEGARLRGALLSGVNASAANLTDADLRDCDLRGADLSGAKLCGADLRGALLSGVSLRKADLTGARLPDVDLVDAIIDGATFNQADIAGIQWAIASATGADLCGALGLGTRDRDRLRLAGAIVDDIHLELLLGKLGARPIQLGMGILALGMSAYLAARFLGSDVINPAHIEVQAISLRETDPAGAAERYVELADLARRVEDQVGYLVEAAILAGAAGDPNEAESLLENALEAAQGKPSLALQTRLRLAVFHHEQQRWTESLIAVTPLIQSVDQPTEQRARAIVLFDKNRDALGLTGASERDAVFSSLGDLPETQADLHLALAELYTHAGDTPRALTQVETAEALDVPADIQLRLLEARARILDRSGDVEGAIRTWAAVQTHAAKGSIPAQAAPLAIADLHLRVGRIKAAERYLEQVLDRGTDNRIRGRALLVSARISVAKDKPESALNAYRAALKMSDLDTETLDEARISMASLVLSKQGSEQGSEQARTLLDSLAPEALSEVLAQAKLGEARRFLDAGDAAGALPIFKVLVADDTLTGPIRRASQAGLGETLAQLGELREALDIWRTLLARPGSRQDRIQLELLVANGLLQGGRRKEAATAFRSLADSENVEAQAQGLLGLAEVARSTNERERAKSLYRTVADQPVDPVWRVMALQELADLAAEEMNADAVVKISRELLGALPPGHISAPQARLSLIAALIHSHELQEAKTLCQTALSAAPTPAAAQVARVACAEVDEQMGAFSDAWDTYAEVLQGDAPIDVHTDAALGLARCAFALDTPENLLEPLGKILAKAKAPALRLPLISMKIRALTATNQPGKLTAATAERDAIAEQIPGIAYQTFIEIASEARFHGEPERAVRILERAMDLPIGKEERGTIEVELGHVRIDLGQLDVARARFEQALKAFDEDNPGAFYAGLGLAEIDRRSGELKLALARLKDLHPPDTAERHSWMASQATILTEMGDPASGEAWAALAAETQTDPQTRFMALKGQADALMGQDKPQAAIRLYKEARAFAQEDWESGWASLGLASALASTDDHEGAIILFDELMQHPDMEVNMEATLRRSRLASELGQWSVALRSLRPKAAFDLGPAWDASATDARTRALIGAGDTEGAIAAWQALATRWPDEEEAVLPAWLGIAQMCLDKGDRADAHHWARKAYKEARDPGYRTQAKAMVAALDD